MTNSIRKPTIRNSDVSPALAQSYATEAIEAQYGSEEQIEAQNYLTTYLEKLVRPEVFADFEAFCLKATTDEICNEAVRLVTACR
jgi:hypothetical protein